MCVTVFRAVITIIFVRRAIQSIVMALDPRLECLPEHEGPAFRTWQLIMQTTMGKVMQPTGFQFGSVERTKSKTILTPADEFISLNTNDTETNNALSSENENTLKRKKYQSSETSDDSADEEEQHSVGTAPWKQNCSEYPDNAYGLHLEIKDFFNYMSPLPEEKMMRKNVVQRLSDLIVSIWPAAKVEVFGSFRTDLYLPTSDIDLVVFGKWEKLPLFTLEKALINKEIAEPASIKVLDKASVPIIKLMDKLSKIHVDISFNTESSVKSAEMVKSYIQEYKILPYLFITLKYFLLQRDLNEVFTGGISSYCLMLLTISFLQRHRRREDVKSGDANIGVLLMEFFELYGRNFNYQRIGIKIKNGGCYISKEEIKKELGDGEYPSLLCIEDPVTLACDIGKSCYGILRVKEAFEYAFNVVDSALRNKSYFKVNPNSTYLSRIISIPQELANYRKWVKVTFDSSQVQPRKQPPVSISPLYHVNMNQYQGNGRPALLPTPTSPYSPHLSVVTSPYSPYTTNYSPVAFFGGNTVPRQQLILHSASTNNAAVQPTQMNHLPGLHMPPQCSNTMTPNLQIGQVGYVVPGVFSPQVEQVIQKPTTPVFSPEKVHRNSSFNSSHTYIKRNQNVYHPNNKQSYERTNTSSSQSSQSYDRINSSSSNLNQSFERTGNNINKSDSQNKNISISSAYDYKAPLAIVGNAVRLSSDESPSVVDMSSPTEQASCTEGVNAEISIIEISDNSPVKKNAISAIERSKKVDSSRNSVAYTWTKSQNSAIYVDSSDDDPGCHAEVDVISSDSGSEYH